ncbi:hypothetical protein B0H11DRAFT_1916754 [Mycena galericulata]|nr:hypothetical protein B0H11DRAFT_1916754 [Mycena galericulata]
MDDTECVDRNSVFAARFLDSPRLPGAGYFALTRREVSVYALLNRRARELIRLAFRPSSTGTVALPLRSFFLVPLFDGCTCVITTERRYPRCKNYPAPPRAAIAAPASRASSRRPQRVTISGLPEIRDHVRLRPVPPFFHIQSFGPAVMIMLLAKGCDDPRWRDWQEENVWGGPAAWIIRMGDLPCGPSLAHRVSFVKSLKGGTKLARPMDRYRERPGSLHVDRGRILYPVSAASSELAPLHLASFTSLPPFRLFTFSNQWEDFVNPAPPTERRNSDEAPTHGGPKTQLYSYPLRRVRIRLPLRSLARIASAGPLGVGERPAIVQLRACSLLEEKLPRRDLRKRGDSAEAEEDGDDRGRKGTHLHQCAICLFAGMSALRLQTRPDLHAANTLRAPTLLARSRSSSAVRDVTAALFYMTRLRLGIHYPVNNPGSTAATPYRSAGQIGVAKKFKNMHLPMPWQAQAGAPRSPFIYHSRRYHGTLVNDRTTISRTIFGACTYFV